MLNRRTFLSGMALAATARPEGGMVWPSEPPAGCPFPPSPTLRGIEFTGRQASYTNADTWYPSWASDGNLYSPWTDGKVGDLQCMSFGKKAETGYATILGDSPLDLQVVNAGVWPGDPAPYGGRYPCGSLVYNGVWYYGTYCLLDSDGDPGKGLNWDILGPFVGYRWSTDFGKTWQDSPHTPANPLFGEPGKPGGPVRMGSPHFIDFGRNMQHSPDGKAYLVGHGAVAGDPEPRPANASWITGDQIYLARVTPSIANMNDRARYEFFAGHDKSGRPRWTRRFAHIRPLIEWNNHLGCVTATYNPALKKYLMCVTDGVDTISRFHTMILEADAITGPWRMVVYMRNFGEQGYFVHFPSKFIGADGRTLWLMYAANFKWKGGSNPPGSRYGMCLQEVRLAG